MIGVCVWNSCLADTGDPELVMGNPKTLIFGSWLKGIGTGMDWLKFSGLGCGYWLTCGSIPANAGSMGMLSEILP